MTRNEDNERALRDASKNAQKAFDAAHSKEFDSVPEDEKVAWAMVAVIHCDLCRLVVAFDECEREGLSRLLWMADIVSKLYEAKRWYFGKGVKLLGEIAKKRGCGPKIVSEKIKQIRRENPIEKTVEKYSKYRNKVSYHYDTKALTYLEKFGNEDADKFYELLMLFTRFSGEWVQLTNSLIKGELQIRASESE